MVVSAPWACDDDLTHHSNGGRPPRGHDHNSFLTCPRCGKKNHPTNKCWKQLGKLPIAQRIVTPSTTLSPTSLSIPTPHYHVTLTLVEYDVLRHFGTINASSLASLASLLAPFKPGTSALLASSSLL